MKNESIAFVMKWGGFCPQGQFRRRFLANSPCFDKKVAIFAGSLSAEYDIMKMLVAYYTLWTVKLAFARAACGSEQRRWKKRVQAALRLK